MPAQLLQLKHDERFELASQKCYQYVAKNSAQTAGETSSQAKQMAAGSRQDILSKRNCMYC